MIGLHSPVTSGIPEGSIVEPCPFAIFINDLPAVTSSVAQMFADDTKVYRQIHGPEDQQKLQQDIDSLSKWSETWQLRFNVKKCKVLHLYKKNNPLYPYSMSSDGVVVNMEVTEIEKDLGVNCTT